MVDGSTRAVRANKSPTTRLQQHTVESTHRNCSARDVGGCSRTTAGQFRGHLKVEEVPLKDKLVKSTFLGINTSTHQQSLFPLLSRARLGTLHEAHSSMGRGCIHDLLESKNVMTVPPKSEEGCDIQHSFEVPS